MRTLVLMYHNVVNSSNDLHLYDVSLDAFKEQMGMVKSKGVGFRVRGAGEEDSSRFITDSKKENLLNAKRYPLNANLRDTILTFDDGYSFWANEVLDILKENGLKAYFFVCLEFLKNGSITREDIIKLKKNGMTIGSHGMKHRFLHKLPEGEVFYELNESKKILEDIIQREIEYFSVPRGVHNRKILKIAQDVGYKKIFISKVGLNTEDSFIMKRIPIRRDTSLVDFKNIAEGRVIRRQAFSQKMKDLGKRVLGLKYYNKIRNRLIYKAE